MFTGLIHELGEVISIENKSNTAVISIKCKKIISDVQVGDSISVNGVCLTVTKIKGEILSFDVSFETLRSTNIKQLKRLDKVNIEPSLKPSSKLGGHFVTGHVDGIGRIRAKKIVDNVFEITIETSKEILDFLVKKGSIAVDGISLTVVDVLRDSFTVVIIPHTASMTTIGFKNVGDIVNLEVDILGKYVAKFLNFNNDSTLFTSLKKAGFIKE